MKVIRIVLYWVTVILPLIDAIRGIKDGARRAAVGVAQDVALARQKAFDEQQIKAFRAANFVPGQDRGDDEAGN